MSAVNPPPAPTLHRPPASKAQPNQITIISHSNLYYWWPVWLLGFILAIVTYFEGFVMAVVPVHGTIWVVKDGQGNVVESFPQSKESEAKDLASKKNSEQNDKDKGKFTVAEVSEPVAAAVGADVTIETPTAKPVTYKDQVVVYVPQSGDSTHLGVQLKEGNPDSPYLRVSPHKALGVVFVFVLLMVIFITNVPLRGMWSLLVIVVAVALVIVFTVLGWIEIVLGWLYLLDVRINMAGYMTMSLFLFIIWLVALLIFDKQRYVTFTPGQFKVCDEIGGGEQVYSTDGLTLQKQRSDFFRHYVLGLGSGDLIIRTAGAQAHHIDLPNVLFINAKVRQIEELIARKAVVETN